jgi:hypothetical protein
MSDLDRLSLQEGWVRVAGPDRSERLHSEADAERLKKRTEKAADRAQRAADRAAMIAWKQQRGMSVQVALAEAFRANPTQPLPLSKTGAQPATPSSTSPSFFRSLVGRMAQTVGLQQRPAAAPAVFSSPSAVADSNSDSQDETNVETSSVTDVLLLEEVDDDEEDFEPEEHDHSCCRAHDDYETDVNIATGLMGLICNLAQAGNMSINSQLYDLNMGWGMRGEAVCGIDCQHMWFFFSCMFFYFSPSYASHS